MTRMRGLGGFSAQEFEAIERLQAERDYNVKPGPYTRKAAASQGSLTRADWERIGTALQRALES